LKDLFQIVSYSEGTGSMVEHTVCTCHGGCCQKSRRGVASKGILVPSSAAESYATYRLYQRIQHYQEIV